MILILAGIPIYAFLKARKESEGTALEPVDASEELVVNLTEPELTSV